MNSLKDYHQNWEMKRSRSLIGYMIIGCLCGIDYTIVITTLYLYLKDLTKAESTDLYYGLTISMFILSSIISSLIFSRIIDKTRNARFFTFLSLILQTIGNAIYAIYFSPIYILLGRFVAGTGDFFRGLACAEISRIYENEDRFKSLWMFTSAFSLGATIGPALGGLFQGIHFNIGSFTVTYLNFPGILLSCLNILALIASHFLINDCSKELGIELQQVDGEKELILSNTESSSTCNLASDDEYVIEETIKIEGSHPGILRTLKAFLLNGNISLIMISTLVFSYSLFFIDFVSPIIVMETLNWSMTAFSSLWAANALLYFLLMIVGTKICTNMRRNFWATVICSIGNLTCLIIIIVIKILPRKFLRDVLLMLIFQIPYSFTWMLEEVLFTCFLATMVEPNIQCFAESFRCALTKLSSLFAALIIPAALQYLPFWTGLLCILVLVLIFRFLAQRKNLINAYQIHVVQFRTE